LPVRLGRGGSGLPYARWIEVDRSSPPWPGFFAGVAAGSSLLSAAAAPVLLVWMLFYNRAGRR